MAEIIDNTSEKMVLTSLGESNSDNLHNKFFPYNKIISTPKYNHDFFVKIFSEFSFDQVYIFGSISIVNDNRFSEQDYFNSTIGLVKSLTEALIKCKQIESVKIFHSSSVEMFGKDLPTKQNEFTTLNPQSPYANGKALAHTHLQNLREKGICNAINGIMYNHESVYRKKDFVTQKICLLVAEILMGQRKTIPLGNIDVYRDWSYAHDLITAAKFGMDRNLAGDYILASGVTRSLSDWIGTAFKTIGITDWSKYIEFNTDFVRNTKEYLPRADTTKSKRILNLHETLSFESLVNSMVTHNIKVLENKYRV